MSQLFDLYKHIGNGGFSTKICEIVPYFQQLSLSSLHCGRVFRSHHAEHPKVHNHLGTVHAIAMCNLAEIAAGLMTDVSIPETCRWIPIGMNVRYLAKAKTDLRGIADGREIDWDVPGDKDVPVSITDRDGLEVCSATITMKVSLKK